MVVRWPGKIPAGTTTGEFMTMEDWLPTLMAAVGQPMRAGAVDPNDPSTWRNAGRNALCPCGSGRKYKHCHGKFGA